MQVFATREFSRRARKAGTPSANLLKAVARIGRGSIDAQLGGGLVKQRVEIAGRGRSAGARVIVFWKREEFALLLHMFLKNEKDNLSPHELEIYREAAAVLARLGPDEPARRVAAGQWSKVE
jgi:hypothetical protein